MVKHGLGPYAGSGYERDMPGFDQILTEHQIWTVLAFIKSTWPEDVRERQKRAKLGGGP
jgi:mono/diheme cytochrome c family protein